MPFAKTPEGCRACDEELSSKRCYYLINLLSLHNIEYFEKFILLLIIWLGLASQEKNLEFEDQPCDQILVTLQPGVSFDTSLVSRESLCKALPQGRRFLFVTLCAGFQISMKSFGVFSPFHIEAMKSMTSGRQN